VLGIQLLFLLRAACSSRILVQLVCFLLSTAAAEFSKRALYAFQDVPQFCYYLMLISPDLVFLTMVISQRGRFRINKIYLAVGLLLMCSSLLQNPATSVLANFKTEYMYTILIIAPAAFWSVSDIDLREFRRIIYSLALLASLYGTYQFVFGYPRWEINWFDNSPTEMVFTGFTNGGTIFRAFSLFSGLHEFALFLCFAGAFAGFTSSRSRLEKCLALFPLAVGLFVSNAKGVYVAIPISVALFALRQRLSAVKVMAVVLAPVAFFFLASNLLISGISEFLSTHLVFLARYASPDTSVPRLMIFADFFSSLDPHSLKFYAGSGIGSVITANGTAMVLDNNYLEILADCGLVGLIGFLLLMLQLYREYFWLIKNAELTRKQSGILNASFFYVTTVLFDLYGSVDFATRGVVICFLAACMLIHTQYKRSFKRELSVTKTHILKIDLHRLKLAVVGGRSLP
jgi:hypothetical protein